MKYVAGFLVSPDREVLLIEKQKPAWQKGKHNAVGGKIEAGETPHVAMRREFKEETGLDVDNWVHTVTLKGYDWQVYFFVASGNPSEAKQMEEEKLSAFPSANLPPSVIPNLHWILPLSLDTDIVHPVEIVDKTIIP